jgi:tetratricopeptide (TPR) repeat protein
VPLPLSSRLACLLLILILAAPSVPAAASPPETTFTEANRLYEQERYLEAIDSYQELLQQGVHSPALHFNLANALFQSDRTGQAILHYRIAQQLDPRDPAIRANLRFARQSTGMPQAETLSPWNHAVLRLTLNEWTILTLVALWSCLALLALCQLQPKIRPTLRPWILVLALTTLLSLLPLFTAWNQYRRPVAIVIVPHASVRFGPLPESQEHYVLPDGAELDVLDQFHEWLQVRDPQGRLGWLTTSQVARLP